MKSSWLFIIYVLWLNGYQCAPTRQEETNLRENLKLLSEVGEKYVDEEVKKALIGIKQMKIMMERNEDKHVNLMKTLKKSSEEKQVEDFLRKIPPLIFTFHEDQGKDIQFNGKPEKEDTQLVKMEDLFSQLLLDMGSIFDRSFIFFKQMQKEFDQSFQTYFMSDLDLNVSPSMPALPEDTPRNDGSQKVWGIPGFLQIVFDFSKTVFEGVTDVITEVFDEYRDNRRNVPEQAKDPDRSGTFSKIVSGHQRPLCRELRENSSGCPQFRERCQKCQDNLLHECQYNSVVNIPLEVQSSTL
uniref:Clusterin-like protein 1 n=1 Tax=Accipiter nisus TaxID=211598 RepID=A0A8B9RUL4_9AVES